MRLDQIPDSRKSGSLGYSDGRLCHADRWWKYFERGPMRKPRLPPMPEYDGVLIIRPGMVE